MQTLLIFVAYTATPISQVIVRALGTVPGIHLLSITYYKQRNLLRIYLFIINELLYF